MCLRLGYAVHFQSGYGILYSSNFTIVSGPIPLCSSSRFIDRESRCMAQRSGKLFPNRRTDFRAEEYSQ